MTSGAARRERAVAETQAVPTPRQRARPKAWIDPESCSGCMVCLEVCPLVCISKQGEQIYPYHVYGYCVVDRAKCTGCRACQRHCPWEAIETVTLGSQLS